jgi:hypothetical protein
LGTGDVLCLPPEKPLKMISPVFSLGTPWMWKCQQCSQSPCGAESDLLVAGNLCRLMAKEFALVLKSFTRWAGEFRKRNDTIVPFATALTGKLRVGIESGIWLWSGNRILNSKICSII